MPIAQRARERVKQLAADSPTVAAVRQLAADSPAVAAVAGSAAAVAGGAAAAAGSAAAAAGSAAAAVGGAAVSSAGGAAAAAGAGTMPAIMPPSMSGDPTKDSEVRTMKTMRCSWWGETLFSQLVLSYLATTT